MLLLIYKGLLAWWTNSGHDMSRANNDVEAAAWICQGINFTRVFFTETDGSIDTKARQFRIFLYITPERRGIFEWAQRRNKGKIFIFQIVKARIFSIKNQGMGSFQS